MKITNSDVDTILHSCKTVLRHVNEVWIKNNAKEDLLDVPIGGYHGAEVCQLIVLFLLNNLNLLLSKDNFELYRDDGFFIIKMRSKRIIEKIIKDTRAVFSEQNLKDRIRQPQDRLPGCKT